MAIGPDEEPERSKSTSDKIEQDTPKSTPNTPPLPAPPSMAIPPSQEINAYQEKNYRLSQRQFVVAAITLFVLAIYTTVAGYQAWKMRTATTAATVSADAAKRAADIAANELELAERPWVDANITLNGPLTFNINGASIPLKIAMRNTGHSPALSTIIWPVPLIGSKGANASSYRENACQEATRVATTMPQFGLALFPNTTFEQPEGIGLSKDDIEAGKASKEFPGSKFGEAFLAPAVVVCIAYRPTFNQNSVYHTSYIVDLVKVDSAGLPSITFKIGENVDQQHLRLQLHSAGGAINAN